MEPAIADAYARLARRSRLTSALVAEVLGIVGGSRLGVALPDIWRDYRKSSDQATVDLNAGSGLLEAGGFVGGWSASAHILPVGVLTVAVTVLLFSRWYEKAQACYEDAAKPKPSNKSIAPVQIQPPRGLRRRLLRFLS